MKKTLIKSNQILTTMLIVLLAVSMISMVVLQSTAAQATKKSYAVINAVPNPIGVGQETLLTIGVTEPTAETIVPWIGLTVTVTKPDGTNETLGPFDTDSTGLTGYSYVPNEPGNYTLQTHFPAQWMNYTGMSPFGPKNVHTFYTASDSEPFTLIVQEEPIQFYPGHALPSEYWSRPIDAQLREWYTIAGSWTYDPANRFAPYNAAPESAHVLWTTPLTMGGVVGGEYGLLGSGSTSVGMGIGDAYEGKWTSRFIVNGLLYYNDGTLGIPLLAQGASAPILTHCVDLHTGQELWAKTLLDNRTASYAQLFYWQSYNYQGTYAYLWVVTSGPTGENWYAFDAYTGNWDFTVENVPAGTTIRDENGGLYKLQMGPSNRWAALWNMSAFATYSTNTWALGNWGDNVRQQTFIVGDNAARDQAGWMWNKTLPASLPGQVQTIFFDDKIVGSNLYGSTRGAVVPPTVCVWAVSLKHGNEGTLLYNTTWNAPTDWIQGTQNVLWDAWSAEDNIGTLWSKELRAHYGVDLSTGKLIWGPTASQFYLDAYEPTALIAYNKLYSCGVSGILYCYDVKTGNRLWTYAQTDPYTENLWSNNWWLDIHFISDGKVYIGTYEHSPNQPLPRGAPFACINATDGSLIWRVDGMFRQTDWGGKAIIGDSIIATMDTYDLRVYAIGKGPSSTTITASPKVTTFGSSIQIEGTVNDISPGTGSADLALRFPNGVAAVSNASQSDWMLYVYKQLDRPTNATGVPVTLSVVDANGNYRTIGSTTSDSDGFFSFNWKPDIEGQYTVYATFEGSNSYYPSHSVTSFAVDPAPVTPTAQPTQASSMADLYFIPGIIGVIVAIIIVGAVIILALRKRP